MELIKIENGAIALHEEVEMKLKAFQVEKARMEMLEKEIKEAMLQAMEQNGIKSYESENVKITYVAETVKKGVDTKALKEQGLYELYCKETPVKASVRISWK